MIVDALDQAWRAWAELGAMLEQAQWDRPTRLEGWNVKHVYAHNSGFPPAIAQALESPPVEAPVTHTSAVELLATMQQPGGVAETAADWIEEQARALAADQPTSDLVEQFRTVARDVIAELREADLTRRIDYGGNAVVEASEGLRIATMEAVVHYFDMASALHLPMPGPMAGEPVEATVGLLTGLTDPLALIELATGRTTPRVFPVLR